MKSASIAGVRLTPAVHQRQRRARAKAAQIHAGPAARDYKRQREEVFARSMRHVTQHGMLAILHAVADQTLSRLPPRVTNSRRR